MKHIILILLVLSSSLTARAESSDKKAALNTLITNISEVQAFDITGKIFSRSAATILAEALAEPGVMVLGTCELNGNGPDENCVVDFDAKRDNGLRIGYDFRFKKLNDKIIGNTVSIIIGL